MATFICLPHKNDIVIDALLLIYLREYIYKIIDLESGRALLIAPLTKLTRGPERVQWVQDKYYHSSISTCEEFL